MSKIGDILGIIAAVVIIALAVTVLTYDVSMDSPKLQTVKLEEITAPQYEKDKSYGGDAYTGMQQASAQAANNIIPVFDALTQTNDAVKCVNENLSEMVDAEAENLNALAGLVKYCFGTLMLSLGLLTAVKHIGNLVTPKKKEYPVGMNY